VKVDAVVDGQGLPLDLVNLKLCVHLKHLQQLGRKNNNNKLFTFSIEHIRGIDDFLIELSEYYRNCPKGCRDYKAW
jgi:hypothetical protein